MRMQRELQMLAMIAEGEQGALQRIGLSYVKVEHCIYDKEKRCVHV